MGLLFLKLAGVHLQLLIWQAVCVAVSLPMIFCFKLKKTAVQVVAARLFVFCVVALMPVL